ncbi:hypothetical protein CLV86_1312 [Lacinutrix venerupis]|uniref:hypothetical protein n=1 Tax=Lacinutrix venerupis TaxID=1486034 RepID=UPI000F29591D|nr:hypothetical protein [Lacinutrix venerupis]RLJ65733.1 hypothetical protein CLV86_1312 [Lacinutrix venerupis]
MKKLKSLALLTVFAGSMLYSPTVDALPKKRKVTFAHIFENGCVGTHTVTYSSSGEVIDHDYEVFACP